MEPTNQPISETLIRAAEPSDAQAIHAIHCCPRVLHYLIDVPSLSVHEVEQTYFNKQDRSLQHLVAQHGNRVVGHAGIYVREKHRIRHVGRFFVAIHDDFHRRGIGRALTRAIIHLSDSFLGLKRIELEVNADNGNAIALYQSLGFEVEGRLRSNVLRDGAFIDSLLMARIRDESKTSTPA